MKIIDDFEKKTRTELQKEIVTMKCGNKVPIYTIETINDLIQYIGYGKYKNCKTEKVCTAPNCTDSTKSPYGRNISLSNKLTSFFKRGQFRFELDSLVVVEIDILIYQQTSFVKSFEFNPVDTFCFEY